MGKKNQADLPENELVEIDTKVYNDKLLSLFEAIVKDYMTDGFVKIERMRQATSEILEEVFDREKKTAKVFNKMLDELSELEDYATEKQEQIKEDKRNAPFIEIQQLKKDRVGEFYADLTLNNQFRKKREVIIETKKKSKKEAAIDDGGLPEGLQVDDEDIIMTNQKNVGDIDLHDMKKKKNAKEVNLSEFGLTQAQSLPMTAAEREAKRQEELKKAVESDPSLAIETDQLQTVLNYLFNAMLGAFTLGVMFYIARGTNQTEGGE